MNKPTPPISAIKLALMARQVRAQAEQVLRSDPIAIVGMACRVPGGGDTPAQFWRLLREGVDTIREVPADRWDGDAWYDPDLSVAGKSVTKWAGFLDQIDGFDADYFSILPREAERMDPQQRLLLEVAIEAIDDAGMPHGQLRGSRTGVYIASYHNDYAQLQYGDLDTVEARTLTGTLHSVLANRVSYHLDLRSLSMSIDTACSSSLVAVHLACQSLRYGETNLAIAGGVSLIMVPELAVAMSKVGIMSPGGRCRTFDAQADGFGRGEGCGVVVLKRLSDAIADSDRILAVIRGSAVNQDGRSTLLTAPSGPAQAALIRESLASAQVEPERIGFFEAHGTGTALGDPIEVEAIVETVGRPSPVAGPCLLGSAKANLGHLEAAAGVIGLIKTVLALRHEAVPAQINFSKLNPHISLTGTRLAVPTALAPWPVGALPRCAAVSSFGIGGTNANVIVEEAPMAAPPAGQGVDAAHILTLSAQSSAALRSLAQSWSAFIAETPASVVDLCHTASLRRTHYDHRIAMVARTKDELRARLQDYLAQRTAPGLVSGCRAETGGPRVGFVFSGQGPQWYAMGRELLAEEPVFRDVVVECDKLLRPLSDWSLLEQLSRPEERSRLDQTEVAQPALFTLQVALAALWKSFGVSPNAVVGHSVGEIAALHVAGVLELREAIRVVWHRGQVMQQATGLGRMASVGLTDAEAAELVAPYGDQLNIGAVNAPRSVVLSGEATALEKVLATLTARGVSHRMLPVQYAFHSAQMAPFQRQLADRLGDVRALIPSTAVYSTVVGRRADDMRFDAAYFGRNVREPVRFAAAIGAMAEDAYDLFIEIGPQPVLAAAIAESFGVRERSPVVLGSLRRGRPERDALLQACAGAYAAGCDLAWARVQPGLGHPVELPSYPWQRKRYWLRERPAPDASSASVGHPLLGHQIAVAGIADIFEANSEKAQHWLRDHRIFRRLLLPAAAVFEMFAVAAGRIADLPRMQLTGLAIHRPLALPETGEGQSRWQVVVKRSTSRSVELELHATDGGSAGWQQIASAMAEPAGELISLQEPAASESISPDTVYAEFKELGADLGPAFQCLHEVERDNGFACAWIELPPNLKQSALQHSLHPVLIDAGFQLCALAAVTRADKVLPEHLFLPLGADRVVIHPGAYRYLRARARSRADSTDATLIADVWFETPDGQPALLIEGMRCARAEAKTGAVNGKSDRLLYDVAWQRASASPVGTPSKAEGTWLLFADQGGSADALAAEITAAGGSCGRVVAGNKFKRTSRHDWMIDPAEPDHLRRVLREGGWDSPGALRGVVHCWTLDLGTLNRAGEGSGIEPNLLGSGAVLHLVQALATTLALSTGVLWLVTRGAQTVSGAEAVERLCPRAAGLFGLTGVIALEHPELNIRIIDLDPDEAAAGTMNLLPDLLSSAPLQSAVRGGARWVPRLQRYGREVAHPNGHCDGRLLQVALVRRGTFDGIELQPGRPAPLLPEEVRLRILAAGINFRDVLVALGIYPGTDVPLGAECAGVVTEVGADVSSFKVGDRVFGFAPASLATQTNVRAAFLAPLPAGMRAEDAAGLPIAFLTADYGLTRLARLRPGQRVLIHAATGGVGLAAVQLAQRLGAVVFATAGSPAKRELLRSLGIAHVMDSRSLTFADQVLADTHGKGVDVVLNSLAGEFITASMRTLARGGCFLELGKRGIWSSEAVAKVRPDVRYHAYDLGDEAHEDNSLLRPMLDAIVAAVTEGSLRPLPTTVFPLERVGDAMRFMAQAKHVGKIVVRVAADAESDIPAQPRKAADGTYWITGGLGGLGRETARWLVHRGARHLVLSGRREPDKIAKALIRELEALGANVQVFQADAADRNRMQFVRNEIRRTLPPLRGVVHAAGVVRDAALISQRWAEGSEILRSKADAAWLLHDITRDIPLEFFVLYSAAGVVLGAPGQALYSAANAELDALARFRRRLGLPGLSVAWGPWAGAGMAADLAARGNDVLAARGLGNIDPASGFAQLDRLLVDRAAYGAVIPIQWSRFLAQLPAHADSSFFSDVAPTLQSRPTAERPAHDAVMVDRFAALPVGERRHALLAHLVERTLHVLGLDAATPIDRRVPLREIGLDSLMSVELRNILVRSGGRPLPATLLFDYPSLDALARYLARKWRLEADTTDETIAEATPMSSVGPIAELSDMEAEVLLVEELKLSDVGRTL